MNTRVNEENRAVYEHLYSKIREKGKLLEKRIEEVFGEYKGRIIRSELGVAWMVHMKYMSMAIVDANIPMLEKIADGIQENIDRVPIVYAEEEKYYSGR